MSGAAVIFIDDDPAMRRAAEQWFSLAGLETEVFSSAPVALNRLDAGFAGVVVSDVRMPGFDGIDVLRTVRAVDPEIPVILLTGHGDIALAVEAMREGAHDFLEKPFDPDRVLDRVKRALKLRRLVLENRRLRQHVDGERPLEERLIGQAPSMVRLRGEIAAVAPTDASVLIVGATGTGKEVVARALHDLSPRASKPFVAINTAALPETMAEAELFGFEKGAFTGANERRAGLLVHAAGGTVFLDELSAMAMPLQAKVLRAIENREVTPIGSNTPVTLDIRVVAATNEPPERAVAEGRLRADLLYRLDVLRLELPSLGERGADIPLLFERFVGEAALRHGRPVPDIDPAFVATLGARAFPGNVRELRNLAERFLLTRGAAFPEKALAGASGGSLKARLDAFEKAEIEAALKRHQGNVGAVLDELDLPRRTLNEKMVRLGIRRAETESGEPV